MLFRSNKYGVYRYSFADDTFNESVEKLQYLWDGCFSKLSFQVKFTAYLRLDLIMAYPEMIDLLKKMGLESALFGIETLDHQNAKVIGKGKDPKEQLEFLKLLKREWPDTTLFSGFIYGLPYDTVEKTTQEYIDFINSNDVLDTVVVVPLYLLNNSDLKNKIHKDIFKKMAFDKLVASL